MLPTMHPRTLIRLWRRTTAYMLHAYAHPLLWMQWSNCKISKENVFPSLHPPSPFLFPYSFLPLSLPFPSPPPFRSRPP